jgi:hypothetical protein
MVDDTGRPSISCAGSRPGASTRWYLSVLSSIGAATPSVLLALARFLRHNINIAARARTAKGTPIPIPTLEPVDKPLGADTGEGADVGLGVELLDSD